MEQMNEQLINNALRIRIWCFGKWKMYENVRLESSDIIATFQRFSYSS